MAGVAVFGLPEAVESFLGLGGSVMALVPWLVLKENKETFKDS